MKKLSEQMQYWRAERPDEWKMDEFIRQAKKLEDLEFNALLMADSLSKAKDWLLKFSGYSHGSLDWIGQSAKSLSENIEHSLSNPDAIISKIKIDTLNELLQTELDTNGPSYYLTFMKSAINREVEKIKVNRQ